MGEASLCMKLIFFLSSLTFSYSKYEVFDVTDIDRILKKENCGNLCMTPGCVKTAARIISFLDESVDPCENFYKFACGNWMSNNDIPEGKDRWGPFQEVGHEVEKKLKALIQKKLDGTEPVFAKMLKDFYDTCVDLESMDKLGSEPLKKDLEILGGWPVVQGSEWNESSFDWVDTLIAFRRLGYDFDMLIDLSVNIDERTMTYGIKLDRPPLGDRMNLIRGLDDSDTAADYKTGVKAAVLLGADENATDKELLEVLQFKIELAKISITEREEKDANKEPTADEFKRVIYEPQKKRRTKRDVSGKYNKYTVAELQNIVPEIPWLRYFNGLLNAEIGESENVLVSNPVFLKKLAKLLEKTEKRVVANYMFGWIVNLAKYDLSKEWRSINAETEEENEEGIRKELCFAEVSNDLRIALHSYYVRHYFKEDIKVTAMELIKYIHRALLSIIEGSDWMDSVTKKEATDKANMIRTIIGHPNELLNDSAVMEFYESLTISNSSYYENVKNIRKWFKDSQFSLLGKPYNKLYWVEYAESAVANAFYNPYSNTVEIPAGILQNIFFETDRPYYMNFGATGYIIGHELTHGFDVQGKKFDKDGNEVNWWDRTTDELYHKRVQCMIDQYSNYTIENGMKVNGELTLGENIADNGGLKEAYRAYRSWVKHNGPEPLLPGVKYTQNQLFWISAANIWCSKFQPESLESSLQNDHHSPSEFRVIGPMSNLPEFSEDFNCAPDSPMNRKNRCHVW